MKPRIEWQQQGRTGLLLPVTQDDMAKLPGVKLVNFGAQGSRDVMAVLAKRMQLPPVYEMEVTPLVGSDAMREYQKWGVSWLTTHLGKEHGAMLADDMGLGKTMQTVLTWEALGNPLCCVVCPASVRRGWVKEFKKWAGVDCILIEKGSDWAQYDGRRPVITSYELAQQVPDDVFFELLVMDEMQWVKGRGAKRSRHLLTMSQAASYRLGLTGTPMWSRPNDLWMLLRILFPNYRFGTADEFDYAYCNAFVNRWGGKVNTGISNADELMLRLKYVMLRRVKQDVADELPKVTRSVRYVDPTPRARELLRMAMVGSRKLHDAAVATLEAKFDCVLDTASEFNSNCLIATWMKEHAHRLHEMLVKQEKRERTNREVIIITGDLSHKQRDLAIAHAAKSKAHVVATTDSIGVGVDGLQHVTSNIIVHALDWVPIKISQLLARVDRIGQTEPVNAVFPVMRESYDEVVMSTVVEKLDQWAKVFGNDDNVKVRETLLDSKRTEKMEKEVLKAMYEQFGESE